MKSTTLSSEHEELLRKFQEHLLSNQGLAARTCAARVFYVREFFRWRFKGRPPKANLRELRPDVLLHYILKRSAEDSPGRLQALASALRCFGRFLQFSGYSPCDLTAAVPRIASLGRSCLPDYLKPEQLNALLQSVDTNSACGRRNRAIMLCLARLGLRAAEVATLRLDQIHWRQGVLELGAGKGRRERQLPLPKDLGQALAQYLRDRTVPADSGRVFGAIRNGRVLSSQAIGQVVRRALVQAGIRTPRPGAHLLRRTLASHLIQRGVSLKAVADLMGHRCLETTRLYATVNQAMLREVCRPWPKEVAR
jgi:site-specific recombinase XerD